jgi:O-antigen/teichoic acid export membrane protein
VIGHWLGAEAVTRYAVPMRLALSGSAIFGIGVSSLRPTITVQYSQNDYRTLAHGFVFAMRMAVLCGCSGLIAFWLLGPRFIRLWAGPGVFPGSSTFGLQLLLFLIMVLILPSQNVLLATNRHYQFATLCMIEASINLILSLWWVRHLALAGVIGATVTARLVTNAWFVPFVALKTLNLRVRWLARELTPSLIVSSAVAVLAGLLSRVGIGSTGPVAATALTTLMLGLLLSAFWAAGMTMHDRAIARSLVLGLFSRRAGARGFSDVPRSDDRALDKQAIPH